MIEKAVIAYKILLSKTISIESETYNCDLCRERKYYKDRNCDGGFPPSILNENENSVRYVIDKNNIINFCPKILLWDDDVIYLLKLFSLYNNGFLLEEGGVNNQPYWYIEAMLRLSEVKADYEKESSGVQ